MTQGPQTSDNQTVEYLVTEDHRTEFPDPIRLESGEKVVLGKTSEETVGETPGDENWTDWTLCAKLDGSNEGWVPNQVIRREGGHGFAVEDYSARELNVDKGATMRGTREMNGWLWGECGGETGWVPLDKLRKID